MTEASWTETGGQERGTDARDGMLALPAVDLKDGRCVQLVGGRPEEERISLPDPVAIARRWRERGFRALHVVDLDAAMERGSNLAVITRIARESPGELQIGGGIRDERRAQLLLGAGADRIVVGTRAVDDRHWLAELAERFPGRVVVAADIRDGRVLRKGWTETSDLEVERFLRGLDGLSLAGILCTDVAREGRLRGMNREEVGRVLRASAHRVWIAGGISTLEDLRFLRSSGAAGAVLGMALYTGSLNVDQVAREFGG